jgi:protein transport protein SEC24
VQCAIVVYDHLDDAGLALHTFHGNFFVRSTDLLAVPNINPDTAMGVQVQLEENLTGYQTVCFQAALLYTSSKGDLLHIEVAHGP